MPAELVIEAFQSGAQLGDILPLAGLSGPALAKAKLRLGTLRQEALKVGHEPRSDALEEVLQELAWFRSHDAIRGDIAQNYLLGGQLVELGEALVDLCLKQQAKAKELSDINLRFNQTGTSTLIAARSRKALLAEHQRCINELRRNFTRIREIVPAEYKVLERGTRLYERLLFFAGCSIAEITSAGGTTRTSRTTRNRINRLVPVLKDHFSLEAVDGLKSALRAIAVSESNLANLEVSVKRDLAILSNAPGSTSLDKSIEQDRLTPGAWSNSFWPYTLNAVSRAYEAMGTAPDWVYRAPNDL